MKAIESLSFEVLFSRYCRQLEVANFSEYTIRTLETYFHRFSEFLAEINLRQPEAVTAQTLTDFQLWLHHQPTHRGSPRTPASQNRILAFIRSFFAFLHQEGCIPTNPAKYLKYGKEPDALPKNVLTPDEAQKIVEAPDVSTLIGYRDRTILEVLYATGIRKQELLNLTVEDVDVEEGILYVRRGKGKKDRVVPLTQMACQYLETYLKAIRPDLLRGHQTKTLFVSLRYGYSIGVHSLGHIIDRYVKQAGVTKKVTPHLWRHTCATHLLKNNANLRHVQEMLGHKELSTTERYLRVTITDLKEAHSKFHPREKKQG
jgi:integrase/recombinase XerD